MTEAEYKKLIEELQSSSGLRRQKARAALVENGPDSIPYLDALKDSTKHKTRWEVIKALGQIGHKDSVHTLIHALDDDKSDVRWLAAEGLVNVGRESIHLLMHALEEKYKSLHFRNGVHHVLHSIKNHEEHVVEEIKEIMHSLEKHINVDSIPLMAEKIKDKIKEMRD